MDVLKNLGHKFILLIAALILLLAVLFSLAKVLTPFAAGHKQQLATWLSQRVAQTVTIGAVELSWHGFEPVIQLHKVAFLNPQTHQSDVKLDDLELGINLWQSLLDWRIKPGLIIISGTHVKLQQLANHGLKVQGILGLKPIQIELSQKTSQKEKTRHKLLERLFSIRHVYLRNASIDLQRKNGTLVHFTHLQLSLSNYFSRHYFSGSVQLAQKVPPKIAFNALINGHINKPKVLKIKLYLQGQHIKLTPWLSPQASYAGLHLKYIDVGGQLWLNWQRGHWRKLRAILTAENVKLVTASNRLPQGQQPKTFFYTKAHIDLAIHHTSDGTLTLTGNDFYLRTPQATWPQSQLYLNLNQHKSQPSELYVSTINLNILLPLLKAMTIVPQEWQKKIQTLNPSGVIENLLLQYGGATPKGILGRVAFVKGGVSPSVNEGSPDNNNYKIFPLSQKWLKSQKWPSHNFNIQGRFVQLSLAHWRTLPGFTHLSGSFQITPQRGKLYLNSRALTLKTAKKALPHKIQLQHLQALVRWQSQGHTWLVQVPYLIADNKNLHIKGQLALFKPLNKSIVVNTDMHLGDLNVRTILPYLPPHIAHGKLGHWLRQALVRGQFTHACLIVQGPLADFPFAKKHDGQFSLRTGLNNITLHYAKNWPELKHLGGQMQFVGQQVHIEANAGEIYGIPVRSVAAIIPDVAAKKDPKLWLTSRLQGSLSNGIYFLKSGPLKPTVGRSLRGLYFSGPMQLSFKLEVPLKHTKGHVKINGTVNALDDQLYIPQWRLHVSAIKGLFVFGNHDLSAPHLSANLFQQPMQVAIKTEKSRTKKNEAKKSVTLINIYSKMAMSTLKQHFHFPLLQPLTGMTPYHALIKLNKQSGENRLILDSSLQGISVPYPKPFYKAAVIPTHFHLSVLFRKDRMRLNFYDAKVMSGALRFKKANGKLHFDAGNIVLGAAKPTLKQQTHSLVIGGTINTVDWQAWRPFMHYFIAKHFIAKAANSNVDKSVQAPVLKISDLKIKLIKLPHQRFVRTQISAKQHTHNWTLKLQGPTIAGDMTIPTDLAHGVIKANLQRLYLIKVRPVNLAKLSVQPQALPALDIKVADLRYGTSIFGAVSLQSAPRKQGMHIKNVAFDPGIVDLHASGDWNKHNGKSVTKLHGEISSTNVALALQRFHLPSLLAGHHAHLYFNVEWPNVPYKPKLNKMEGTVSVHMRYGRIIKLNSAAREALDFGKVLTLLSVESIPRRLMFDFSDLTDSGFSFDKAQGSFILDNGVIRTEDTHLKGIVADAKMRGKIDFLRKKLNLALTVTPHLTASVPVIVAIAGGPIIGPIAGAATWVANRLLSPEIDKVAQRRYRVTGDWKNPKITRKY